MIKKLTLPNVGTLILLSVLAMTSCAKQNLGSVKPTTQMENDSTYLVPLGGNSYLTKNSDKSSAVITNAGLGNWTDGESVISTYVYFKQAGKVTIGLRGQVLPVGNTSTVKVAVNGTEKTVDLGKATNGDYPVGEFIVTMGYNKIYVQGLSKSGGYFADLQQLSISGPATAGGLVFSDRENMYYWSRRGPSCHLNYDVPQGEEISYYYSEIQVPEGQDAIGSYFMANGFGEGYFGFQVNSPTERRVLFSVWSPYETDKPGEIPDDYKIVLNKKGPNVYTGEFGNEGSGGQSYLKYNWKAGATYKFLLKGQPDGKGNTDYTAWFSGPEQANWLLIASFKRPHTDKNLTRFHSFLENFIPNNGHLGRSANYKNQWVRNKSGNWIKVKSASLSVDDTYRSNQRIDATGGKNDKGFFLKNGGFFNEIEKPGTVFTFEHSNPAPAVDINTLP